MDSFTIAELGQAQEDQINISHNNVSEHKSVAKRTTDLHNKPIGVYDSEEWCVIHKQRVNKNVAATQPVLGQVVCTTGSHIAFRNISADNNVMLQK